MAIKFSRVTFKRQGCVASPLSSKLPQRPFALKKITMPGDNQASSLEFKKAIDLNSFTTLIILLMRKTRINAEVLVQF